MDLKNKMATQVKKIPELDIMKFYGILFVVLGHIAMMYTPLSVIPHFANMSSFMAVVKNVIYAFHMPMFIFISGCIFVFQLEVLRRKITYKSLLRSKINRLLVPFFIIGFFWVLPVMSLLGLRDPIHYAIDGFILAIDPRHLWYVLMLFWAFLLFFFLRTLCLRYGISQLWIGLFAIILYIVYQYSSMRFPYFQIGSLMNYFIWFVFGYFFIIYKTTIRLIVLGAFVLSLYVIVENIFLSDYPLPSCFTKVVFAIDGIALIYYVSKYLSSGIVRTNLYAWIVKNSFGIYLFHPMIIYVIYYGIGSLPKWPINPIITSLMAFVVCIWVSVMLTIVARRIHLRFIVGE